MSFIVEIKRCIFLRLIFFEINCLAHFDFCGNFWVLRCSDKEVTFTGLEENRLNPHVCQHLRIVNKFIKVDQIRLLITYVFFDDSWWVLKSNIEILLAKFFFTVFYVFLGSENLLRFKIFELSNVKSLFPAKIFHSYIIIVWLNGRLKWFQEVDEGHERSWFPIGCLWE